MDGLGLQLVAVDRVLLYSLCELRVGAPVVHLLRVLISDASACGGSPD